MAVTEDGMTMRANEPHLENALSPTKVTDDGIVTVTNELRRIGIKMGDDVISTTRVSIHIGCARAPPYRDACCWECGAPYLHP